MSFPQTHVSILIVVNMTFNFDVTLHSIVSNTECAYML